MILTIAISIVAILVVGILIFSNVKKVYPLGWGWHSKVLQKGGAAIGGYDPVAYLQLGEVRKGDQRFSYTQNGVTWLFSSAGNLETFKTQPANYQPQFGGYCAFAVSKGFTAATNPDAWHVQDGKLYLFADQKVKEDWISQIPEGVIQKCQSNWK